MKQHSFIGRTQPTCHTDPFARQPALRRDGAPLPDADRAIAVYNLACAHAAGGRLDRARPLLRIAFGLRPDLAEFATGDPDLVELREELPTLAGIAT